MENTQPLFQFLLKFMPITESEFEAWIRPHLQVRQFNRREFITSEGTVEPYVNFITKGLVRKYFRKGEGEVTTQIAAQGHLILAQESFYRQCPSLCIIEALEPTTMLSVSRESLESMYNQSPRMERLGRLVITYTLVMRENWQMKLIRLSPRERYHDFVDKHAGLLQRVPQKYVASLLNIQPETFSRFKHLRKGE
jgi:CRP-like cAMP-binding protein